MNAVAGLFLALIGLFLIWAWSSGRAQAVWQAVWAGSDTSGFTSDPGQAAMGSSSAGGWGGLLNTLGSLPSLNPGSGWGPTAPSGQGAQTSGGGGGLFN